MRRISIILPLYNSKEHIQKTLESVLAQTYPHWELVVVDDGSTDDSSEICRAIGDDRIVIYERLNTGPCRSRNFGISAATGDFIAFIDHDDIWLPTKLEAHLAHLDARPEVGVSYGPSQFIDADGLSLGLYQAPKLTDLTTRDILCRNPVGNGSVPLIRQEVLEQVRFEVIRDGVAEAMYFDDECAGWEDVELWFRIQVQTKWIFEGIADCLTQYRIVAGSLASDPEQKQNAFERGIERARLYAPDQIAKFGPAASAYHLRYVARRLIQVGDISNACRYMHRALRIYPGLILDDPGRTISSLGASWALRLMPAAFSRRIVSGAVSVVGARQGKKLDAKVGATTKPFRWGLLGAGSVARQFGLSLDLLDGQEVHAIASRSHSRAAELAESLKRSFRTAPRALDSYEALVADPEIDAIYVSTPAAAHLENVSLALNAGKPVLCEKPFATSAAEARQIADLAAERKVFCMEAMWMRFIPAIRDLKARINRGEVGTVSLLEAELGFTQPFDPTGRHFDPAQGGGALLDLGVYPLSLARYLLGRPDRGQAISDMAATGVDAQTVMNLSFPSGALASLSCSFTQRLRNRALVAGTRGSFLTDDPMYAPGQLTHTAATMAQPAAADASSSKAGWLARMVEKSPKLVSARRRFAPTLRQLLRRERKNYAHHFPGFGYQFEIQEVFRCVASGLLESPDMPLSESVEMMEVIDAFRNGGSFDWRKKP